jgi:hypothetical protein
LIVGAAFIGVGVAADASLVGAVLGGAAFATTTDLDAAAAARARRAVAAFACCREPADACAAACGFAEAAASVVA